MFDGVGWAAGEIVVFMLIATLIGFAIGWIFGRWLQRGTIGDDYESELVAQRERSKKIEERLSAANVDLDKALLEVKAERGKYGEITTELATAQEAAAELETKLADLGEKGSEVERLSAELAATADLDARLQTEAAARADVEAKLEAESAAKADLEGRLAAMGDADTEVARLTADLEACGAERERLAAEAAQSADQIAAGNTRIAALEVELATAVAAVAAPQPASVPDLETVEPAPESVAGEQTDPSKEEGLARIAEIAARTAGDGPVADDDLKKVHGVGPKLERTLKGLGITSFRQIANFHKDDIAYVTVALDAFKGRIERDDWMGSAAEEHAKKYNEPA